MVKSRVVWALLVMVGLFAASIPAAAQVNNSGFSFGTTFVLSKTDDNGRILLTLFGFFAEGVGSALIDVKCPLTEPNNKLSQFCNDDIQVGSELDATTGLPPDPFSDYPTRYELRSVTIGTPVDVSSFSGEGFAPGLWHDGPIAMPSEVSPGLRASLA